MSLALCLETATLHVARRADFYKNRAALPHLLCKEPPRQEQEKHCLRRGGARRRAPPREERARRTQSDRAGAA